MANSFGELLNDTSTVYITGHKMADMDVIGSAVGICCIARAYGTPAKIIVDQNNNAAKTLIAKIKRSAEYKHAFISPQDAIIAADSKSLLVVVDTSRPDRVEAQEMLMSCNRIAVIDHHRRASDYIETAAFNFHEPYASSTCELVGEMLQYLVEQPKLQRIEAEALLAGIVLDTKNFTLRTGSRTFDVASFLRKAGADPQEIKKLMQSDVDEAMKRYGIVSKAIVYKNGIAIAASEAPADRITIAQAADELLNIAGIQASFAVCPCDESIVISGRSIGDVNVQYILEKLGGGGTRSTSGAQIKGKTMEQVMQQLKEAIDNYEDDESR
jgi:c-di-AMP phosphodiesterase-like protein